MDPDHADASSSLRGQQRRGAPAPQQEEDQAGRSWRRAGSSARDSLALGETLARSPRKDPASGEPLLETDIRRKLQDNGRLVEELDQLLSSASRSGKKRLTCRLGQRGSVPLSAGASRTVEVQAPSALLLECSSEKGAGGAKVAFDIVVTDAEAHVASGPYRAQTTGKTLYRLRLSESSSGLVFVGLCAAKDCLVNVLAKKDTGTDKRGASRDSESDEEKPPRRVADRAKKRLEDKLHARRLNALEAGFPHADKSEDGDRRRRRSLTGGPGPAAAALRAAAATAQQRRVERKAIFAGISSSGPRDPNTLNSAMLKVLKLWLGPCSRFFGSSRRAQGRWVHRLSEDCPRKLARWLLKAAQNRRALVSVAAAGAMAFFLARQRELHLTRARMAMRQLAWYKVLCTISRMQYAVVFVASKYDPRERQLHNERSGRMTVDKSAQPGIDHASSTSSAVHSRARSGIFTASGDADTAISEVERIRHAKSLYSRAKRGNLTGPGGMTRDLARSTPAGADDAGAGASTSAASTSAASFAGHRPAERRGALGGRSLTPRGASQPLDQESHLANQGFFVHPALAPATAGRRAAGSREGSRARGRAAGQPQKKVVALAKELADSAGVQTHVTSLLDEDVINRTKVADAQLLVVKVGTGSELERVRSLVGGNVTSRTMAAEQYERYEQSLQKALQDRHLKRLAISRRLSVGIRILKRYLLRFHREDPDDLPWLPLQRSLLFVIWGRTAFLSNHERRILDPKLKDHQESRKVAQKHTGLFAPLELALWSHPVIHEVVSQAQKAIICRNTVSSWKSALFDSPHADFSDRDIGGRSLASCVPAGGSHGQAMRRLLDVSGPFVTSPRTEGTAPDAADARVLEVAFQQAAARQAATIAASQGAERLQELVEQSKDMRYRTADRPSAAARPWSSPRRRSPASPRGGNGRSGSPAAAAPAPRAAGEEAPPTTLLAHSDGTAQRRFASWLLRAEVPPSARKEKLRVLSLFDGYVLQGAAGGAAEGGGRRDQESLELPAWAKKRLQSLPGPPPGETRPPAAAESAAVPAVPAAAPATAPPLSPGAPPPPQRPGIHSALAAPPQTAEDVGRLLENRDALDTIIALENQGRYMEGIIAGWSSGHRQEPMTEEELRTARATERGPRRPAARARASQGPRGRAGPLTAR